MTRGRCARKWCATAALAAFTTFATFATFAAFATLLLAGAAAGQTTLLHEDFESAGSLAQTALGDIYHTGGTDKNIALSAAAAPGHGRVLRWLRRDSGFYYARTPNNLASSTGRVEIRFQVAFDSDHPYWWAFNVTDPTFRSSYVDLSSGLGYTGNEYYVSWGALQYVNPDGTFRSLCPLKTGWHAMKVVVDFRAGTAAVYYDDMRAPVAADLPLRNRPAGGEPPPFRVGFTGFSRAGEAGFSLDDLDVRELPAAPARAAAAPKPAGTIRLAEGAWELQVSRATGAAAGAIAGGRRLLAATDDHYRFEGRDTAAYAAERDDRVQSSKTEGGALSLVCVNPGLPGVVIRKQYRLDGHDPFVKTVTFESSGAEGFVTHYVNVRLDPKFAADSYRAGFPYSEGLAPGELGALRDTPYAAGKDFQIGIATYRDRVNGRYVLPETPTSGTPDGWESREFCDYVQPGRAVSGATRFRAFAGDFLDYARRLVEPAEYRALFPTPRPAWLDSLVGDAMYLQPSMVPYEKAAAPLPVSSTIWFLDPPWGNWWSYSDPPKGRDADVLTLADRFRALAPNGRISAYANELFDQNSDVFKQHPEFGVTDREGHLTLAGWPSDAGGAPTYYLQILNDAARAYFVAMYVERVKNWKLDFLYLDGPGALHEMPDWKLKRCVQSYDWIAFYRDLRAKLAQLGPDRAFWTNGVLPYSDIRYLEWRDSRWKEIVDGPKWRFLARELLMAKVREAPEPLVVPTYGDAGAQPAISTYAIAYGWVGHGAVAGYLPWQTAALEYRDARLVPDAVQPAWWRLGGTVEAYGLRKGDERIVNVISHSDVATAHVTIVPTKLGLTVGREYLLRILVMNAPTEKEGGSAFAPREMRRVTVDGAPMALDVPVRKGLLTTVVLSPALAVAESGGARASETGLTDTYALQLKPPAAAGGAYTLATKYPNAALFFPYADRVEAQSPGVTAAPATRDGVAGVRVTVRQPGVYTLRLTERP